jgi:hypothetical protein
MALHFYPEEGSRGNLWNAVTSNPRRSALASLTQVTMSPDKGVKGSIASLNFQKKYKSE